MFQELDIEENFDDIWNREHRNTTDEEDEEMDME